MEKGPPPRVCGSLKGSVFFVIQQHEAVAAPEFPNRQRLEVLAIRCVKY
jgi:hypothetical protein